MLSLLKDGITVKDGIKTVKRWTSSKGIFIGLFKKFKCSPWTSLSIGVGECVKMLSIWICGWLMDCFLLIMKQVLPYVYNKLRKFHRPLNTGRATTGCQYDHCGRNSLLQLCPSLLFYSVYSLLSQFKTSGCLAILQNHPLY